MRKMHWSSTYANDITLEIPYSDGSSQTWGYDCTVYTDLESLKLNMTDDFYEPRLDRDRITIVVERGNETFSTEFELGNQIRDEFVELVFNVIDGMLNGN